MINNTAAMVSALLHDSRDSALQLSTNVLGHYTLTALRWPALAAARSPRVINVSSLRHFFPPAVFDDPNFQKRDYDPFKSGRQTKTGNDLLTIALDEKGKASGIRSFALHPGVIFETDISRWGKTTPEEAGKRKEMLKALVFFDENGWILFHPGRQIKTKWCPFGPIASAVFATHD
jgi:NAD(P)-dependent dehydrogenase (short-subunit alcohol dehydrogenase family)